MTDDNTNEQRMSLIYADACSACVAKHIGPALDHVVATATTPQYCGGCGRTTINVRVAYWFPFPTSDGAL